MTYVTSQLLAGVIVAVVLLGHEALLRDTVSNTTLDLLQLSLNPWNTARFALQVGLLLAHVAALGSVRARASHRPPRMAHSTTADPASSPDDRLLAAAAARMAGDAEPAGRTTSAAADGRRRCRRPGSGAAPLDRAVSAGSQAFRLTLLTLPLIAPAFAFYPTVVQLARQAKTELVETLYAPEVRSQRQTVQSELQKSQNEIDRFAGLVELVTTPVIPGTEALTDRAFRLWQTTALARYPITSSVELYGADGQLVSRFAFNLPEDPTADTPLSEEESCDWEVLEEVAPFFAEERRVLHAGRALCSDKPGGKRLGSIVVHAMPDYENLPFISSRSPYVELLRPADPLRGEGLAGDDVEFAVYGWSRTPLYPVAGTAWPLADDVFAASRSRAHRSGPR